MTITHAKYNADGSVTAGPIEGQTWSGITEASRFWPMVQAWVDEGNVIEPYVEPVPENPLDKPLPRLRFWLAAASAHISKWDIRDRIAAMPDGTFEEKQEKSEAIAWFEEADQYRRNDPILIRFAAEEGISEQELDALWIWTVESAAPVPQLPG